MSKKCAFSHGFWGVLGVTETWSESAFFREFAPSVYLKDNNQKISHSRLLLPTSRDLWVC